MDGDGDSHKRLTGSNSDNDIVHPISHEEFQIDFLGCPTCFCLSEKGSIEARRKLQGAKVPHSWPDEFKLSFHDLESTWNDCPFCFMLHEIICVYVVQVDRREGAYICARNSLDFSEFKVVSGKYGLEDSQDSKVDDYLVKISYTEPGATWLSIELDVRKLITEYPVLDACLHLAAEWINSCQEEHPDCHSVQRLPDHFPARLINVGVDDGDMVRVVKTINPDVSFVALSYCWGNVGVLTSTMESVKSHMTGISWHLLPKTFQDAIMITRRLRIPYLWIDALCIIQDSPDDWQAESSKMSQIYEIADLVISADLAPNNKVGFLGRRRGVPHIIELPKFPKVKSASTRICCTLSESPIDEQHAYFVGSQGNGLTISSNGYDPVFDRAWCLQERFLATRLLHFTSTEMIWECKTKIRCECEYFELVEGLVETFNTTLAKPGFHQCLLQSSAKAKLSRWWHMVEEYSLRGLTKETDRLPAISGLARRMEDPGLGEYLSGIWRENLPWGLLWRCDGIGMNSGMSSPPGATKKRGSRSKISVAPTWSWASITGPINRPSRPLEKHILAAEILDIRCKPAGPDPYGQVTGGLLQIKAPSVTARICFRHGGWYEVSDNDGKAVQEQGWYELSSNGERVSVSCHPDVSSIAPPLPTQDVLCVLIARDQRKEAEEWARALMVVPSQTSPAVFERIGITELILESGGLRSRMEMKTLTIV